MKLQLPEGYEMNNQNLINWINEKLEEGNTFFLLMSGNTGSGKSYLMQAILNSMNCKSTGGIPFTPQIIDCVELANDYVTAIRTSISDDICACENKFDSRYVFIDDLGREPKTQGANDLFLRLLYRLHSSIKIGKTCVCVITTNMGADEITNRYDPAIMSRLYEVFHFHEMKPKDFRKLKMDIGKY